MKPDSPDATAPMKIIKRDRPWHYYAELAMANALPRHLTAGMIADEASKLASYPEDHPDRLRHANASKLLSDRAKKGYVRRLKERAWNITGRKAQLWALGKPSPDDQLAAKETELRIKLAHDINNRKARAARIALLEQCLAIAASSVER